MGDGDDVRLFRKRCPAVGDLWQPGDVGGDVGHAELCSGDGLLDGESKRDPLLEVLVDSPCLGVAQMAIEHVDFVAKLEVLKMRA